MKIYTKTGDSGSTSLFGGERVFKNSSRIRAYGEVDELNSLIGIVIYDLSSFKVEPSLKVQPYKKLSQKLLRIQSELLALGSDLATPLNVKIKVPRVSKSYVARLEKEIDKWSTSLTPLKNFILPGGGKIGARIHLARTVARRAERSIVDLNRIDAINGVALIYVNRLSDWLFTLARYVNKLEGQSEKIWKGRAKT